MGIYDTDDDDDELDEIQEERRGSNNAMRQVRKALRDAQEQNKTLQEQLAELTKENRSRAISDVLASKGLSNPKIAKLIPADLEPTAEAVSAWLAEYADVFRDDPSQGDVPPKVEPDLPQGVVEQLRDIQSIAQGGLNPSMQGDLMTRINAAQSKEDLDAIFRGMAG